jgi:hypothetical protein
MDYLGKIYLEYHTSRSGLAKIILKINAKILGKLFFPKKYFLYSEKENLTKYLQNMASTKRESSKKNH